MSEPSGSRTVVHVTCSKEWRDRLKAFAKAQGKSMNDVVIDEVSEAMKFHDFDRDTAAARSDWETIAQETAEGRSIT